MQEYLLRQTGTGTGWRATILRLQNVYGPGQSLRNPYTGVLSVFTQQLLSGRSLDIFEDGLISRDFVFVQDVASAFLAAGQHDLPHGTIVDIGSGHAVTILEAVRMLIGTLGYEENRFSVTGRFRPGDVRYACADIRAAEGLLRWSPRTPLDKGLGLFAEWARQQFLRTQAA
jgi:dTDP-L-rhamnose 4-epimerase